LLCVLCVHGQLRSSLFYFFISSIYVLYGPWLRALGQRILDNDLKV